MIRVLHGLKSLAVVIFGIDCSLASDLLLFIEINQRLSLTILGLIDVLLEVRVIRLLEHGIIVIFLLWDLTRL